MTRRYGRPLWAFVAAVFLLSCLVTTAHLAMAGEAGCQAAQLSVRSCGPTLSLDIGPALPGLVVSLEAAPALTAWVRIGLPPVASPQYAVAPLAPRSPPPPFA